jgi:hypothetical protein
MALKDLQEALARLYTDSRLRDDFLRAPAEVTAALGLTGNDAMQLLQLEPRQLKDFAHLLQRKRLAEVHRLLPQTFRRLGSDFERHFGHFAPTCSPNGIDKHRRDALAFGAYLSRCGALPPLLADLARYETACITAFMPGRRWHWCGLRHDLRPLLAADGDRIPPSSPKRRYFVVLWWRPSRDAPPVHCWLG